MVHTNLVSPTHSHPFVLCSGLCEDGYALKAEGCEKCEEGGSILPLIIAGGVLFVLVLTALLVSNFTDTSKADAAKDAGSDAVPYQPWHANPASGGSGAVQAHTLGASVEPSEEATPEEEPGEDNEDPEGEADEAESADMIGDLEADDATAFHTDHSFDTGNEEKMQRAQDMAATMGIDAKSLGLGGGEDSSSSCPSPGEMMGVLGMMYATMETPAKIVVSYLQACQSTRRILVGTRCSLVWPQIASSFTISFGTIDWPQEFEACPLATPASPFAAFIW